jgi:type III secretion protein N (ATPase)
MIARRAEADAIVVALVGERSREVREFIDETLGAENRQRSVIVVATSSDSSLMRQTAPYTATTIAEYLRDQGLNVLLIVDSLTRLARAIRETSLAAGELPVRHGYTNAVYTQLPRLVERAGTSSRGSITALYTVLTNTEDDIDPLADEVKSLLDGHLVLTQEFANLGVLV